MSKLQNATDEQLVSVMRQSLTSMSEDFDARRRFCNLIENEFYRRGMSKQFGEIIGEIKLTTEAVGDRWSEQLEEWREK